LVLRRLPVVSGLLFLGFFAEGGFGLIPRIARSLARSHFIAEVLDVGIGFDYNIYF
jgi:hypothetical protein